MTCSSSIPKYSTYFSFLLSFNPPAICNSLLVLGCHSQTLPSYHFPSLNSNERESMTSLFSSCNAWQNLCIKGNIILEKICLKNWGIIYFKYKTEIYKYIILEVQMSASYDIKTTKCNAVHKLGWGLIGMLSQKPAVIRKTNWLSLKSLWMGSM